MSESDELGVHLIRVPDGVYDRGRSRTNRIEAARVAERAIEHLRRRSDRSLGIVAFSVAQADAITDALERELVEHPDLEHHFTDDRLNGVFVKNLESVQGDERDVMIFSIGYGRDLHGKFAQAFGPLSADGGHRRLNVAITRAREQVDVISSVTAADFDLTQAAKPGARLLRAYLDFAERGPAALREEITALGGDFESPFEAAVAEAIAGLGYQAVPQVGVGGFRIDVGVIDPTRPGRFSLGVECDGATYHSTPTARDRDRLRQSVLEDLGWTIHRIWSRDWVHDRQGEVETLRRAIVAAIETPRCADSSGTNGDLPAREREVVIITDLEDMEVAKLPWVAPYHRAILSRTSLPGLFHEPVSQPALRREFETLLEREAPIELGHAIRRIAELHDISRRGSRIVGVGRQAVDSLVRTGGYELRGDFVWTVGQTLTHVRVPVAGDARTKRAIEEIAPEEIMLAFTHLRLAAGGIDETALITQTARLLGFGATGPRIAEALRGVLHQQASVPAHVEPCPYCTTRNRVVPGPVRCGRCGEQFTARAARLRIA